MVGRWRRLTTLPALVMLASLAACSEPNEPEPKLGSLAITVSGLPDDTPADIVVTGPGGFSRSADGPLTLTDLQAGTYTVQANRVRTDLATFDPVTASYALEIGAGASQATVVYAVITGSLAINVTGLPQDVSWKVRVSGPNGFRDSVSANVTLGNLAPGLYTLSTGEVRNGANIYLPRLGEQIRSVPASASPVQANVVFDLITGLLTVHVNGLPSGAAGSVTVTGPGGFNEQVTSTSLLEGLVGGRYTLAASPVSFASSEYAPSPAQQTVTVTPGGPGLASVNYSTAMAGLNLTIDAVHLQQVVQNSGGAVPTIDNRDALLRVFVRASQPNGASPPVRVRVYHGNELKLTTTIPAPAPGVPTAIDEGDLAVSWNSPLPKDLIRPGLRILAEVDPQNAVVESSESDNTYPSSGAPLPLDVRTVPPLVVRFVPVTQAATGLTGDITAADLPLYAEPLRKLMPVNDVTLELRPPFVSNAAALQPNDANGAWMQVLSEINALRAAEGSSAHYYGVVRTAYTAGVIGLSYLPSYAAIGWDRPPSAYPTFVHEMGHHFGRLHSPGCGAGGADAAYPYQGGTIGVLGFDAATQSLIPPSARDIMTYCDDRWISDYTYTGILGFRAQISGVFAAAQRAATPSLLLWGRIEANRVVLEPAFVVNAPPRLPTFGGPNRLELRDSTGRSLLSLSFTGERVVDGPVPGEQFAFVVPLSLMSTGDVAEIRLTSAGRASSVVAAGESFVPTLERLAADRVRIRWSNVPGRGLIVRDESGAILSLARGGLVEVRTRSTRLDLTLSDGVRSVRRTAVPR